MEVLLIALGAGVLYLVAYHTYGRWLARKLFKLDPTKRTPSYECEDGSDFVPTKKSVVFGHHFTSIAGTGPIVGPAVAVIWGWGPALLWVLFGSIFIGAVHDFGALVVSLRHKGQTVGDISGTVISKRTRLLFLLILFLALTIVLAIFGLVIASVFRMFPQAIFPCVVQIPLAMMIGYWLHRRGHDLLLPSIGVLGLMFLSVYFGDVGFLASFNAALANLSIISWVGILLFYSYLASVLPVWILLQPRDYINSLQLISTIALVVIGLVVAAFWGLDTGAAQPQALEMAAPAYRPSPEGAPMIFPFLFITIACGAVSGFHCLVSSGTSSKQLKCESDAQFVGYGSMLTEGFLAVIVILACVAGLGLGAKELVFDSDLKKMVETSQILVGTEAYDNRYASWGTAGGLAQKIGAFVAGSANFLKALGLNATFATALMGVFVASFAATTLDTACRLQRYIIQEISATLIKKRSTQAPHPGVPLSLNPLSWLANRHGATIFAVVTAALIAQLPGKVDAPAGTGGMLLWPLFGATNQLLAGLTFLVITFWLRQKNLPYWLTLIPAILMLALPAVAMVDNLQTFKTDKNWLLLGIGAVTLFLEFWIIWEALLILRKKKIKEAKTA